MRSSRINITTSPTKYFDADKGRGLLSIRNLHASEEIYIQGGVSGSRDGYPILAGDVLTLERGNISDEIWLWGQSAHDSVIVLVT